MLIVSYIGQCRYTKQCLQILPIKARLKNTRVIQKAQFSQVAVITLYNGTIESWMYSIRLWDPQL